MHTRSFLGLALSVLLAPGCGHQVEHSLTYTEDDVIFSFDSNIEGDELLELVVSGPFDGTCNPLQSFDAYNDTPVVWVVSDSAGLPDTITYGIAPEGAEVSGPATPLELGACYHFRLRSIEADWVNTLRRE